jgi:hypothetical protein
MTGASVADGGVCRTGCLAAPDVGSAGDDFVRAVLTDEASLRQWTAVANDGIIAPAGILEGFAGAGPGGNRGSSGADCAA